MYNPFLFQIKRKFYTFMFLWNYVYCRIHIFQFIDIFLGESYISKFEYIILTQNLLGECKKSLLKVKHCCVCKEFLTFNNDNWFLHSKSKSDLFLYTRNLLNDSLKPIFENKFTFYIYVLALLIHKGNCLVTKSWCKMFAYKAFWYTNIFQTQIWFGKLNWYLLNKTLCCMRGIFSPKYLLIESVIPWIWVWFVF